MPRVPPSALRTARSIHPHLAKLLPVCRDLRSAENELRWLRECARNTITHDTTSRDIDFIVSRLVHRRSRGEPLQYLLGSEYFGELELKCRPGVLIPRPETAASVTHLVKVLTDKLAKQSLPSKLCILDFCTGSGCIPLLFHNEFYKHSTVSNIQLDITGYDISNNALALANENLATQIGQPPNEVGESRIPSARLTSLRDVRFSHYDILNQDQGYQRAKRPAEERVNTPPASDDSSAIFASSLPSRCDVLISNPPYISPSDYMRTTARSVRSFEPKLALVPPIATLQQDAFHEDLGDLFYPCLLDLAEKLSAKLALLEVADLEQAKRVVAMTARRSSWNIGIEIWRDEPGRNYAEGTIISGRSVDVIGEGNGRSVFIWRRDIRTL